MKIYSSKTYLDLDDIMKLFEEVKSRVETKEAMRKEREVKASGNDN